MDDDHLRRDGTQRAGPDRARRQSTCAAFALAAFALAAMPVPGQDLGMIETIALHAGKPFYERPEPEEEFTGRLVATPVGTGPDSRDLPFALEMNTGRMPVYALGAAAEALIPFAGRRVRILGRRVDLRDEGGGVELWPGRISLAP
jgi:hypothetical protein